jgi:hypothetical protein
MMTTERPERAEDQGTERCREQESQPVLAARDDEGLRGRGGHLPPRRACRGDPPCL